MRETNGGKDKKEIKNKNKKKREWGGGECGIELPRSWKHGGVS